LLNLARVVHRMNDEGKRATYLAGADLLNKSLAITPMSPLESGTSGNLRKSGKVENGVDSKGAFSKVSFGDSRVDYALKVHEVEARQYSEPGTQWKYLETPLKENSSKYLSDIAKATKRGLK